MWAGRPATLAKAFFLFLVNLSSRELGPGCNLGTLAKEGLLCNARGTIVSKTLSVPWS